MPDAAPQQQNQKEETEMTKAPPLEKEIEKKICDYAKSKGCYVRKFVSPNNRSVPDRLIIAPGGAVGFLEIKRGGCKPTKAQEAEMELLAKVGARVAWCDNVLDGKLWVDGAIKRGQEDFWG
jgi:hypothetical protein